MSIAEWVALLSLFFVTSVVGVVTGSNSLITVPVMFQFGIEPRVAVATNMFGLTFMSVGGALPFVGKNAIDRKRLPKLVALTLAGSTLGALLILIIPSRTLPLIVSLSMLGVALFSTLKKGAGVRRGEPSCRETFTAYLLTFALGVYGGFFSGGYVTMLTAVYVAFFGMTFIEAVSITKVINIFSSLIATLIFMWRDLIDYKLGVALAFVMFAGAFVGGRLALRMNNLLLRRIFLTTVVALALKILLYDFLWKNALHAP
jgi:uncharacterized membrane protein YfcA